MSKDWMGSCTGSNAVAEGRDSNERLPTSEEQNEQLLPGIPNEITLYHVSTKLPLGALWILSSVCRAWKQAIQSRRVFDARVRCNATETLLAHFHGRYYPARGSRIALYSMMGDCCYELPRIPNQVIGWDSQLISLEGILYVLGGAISGNEVYALDIVGRRKWKQCASMRHRRICFGCGVMGGKIYVFQGISNGSRDNQSEVYDPKVNVWSPVKWTTSSRDFCGVVTLEEELLVFSGLGRVPGLETAEDEAFVVEAYHPIRDEWRMVDHFQPLGSGGSRIVLMFKGKLYLITNFGIYVHNSDNNSWRDLHSNSFPVSDLIKRHPYIVVVTHDELLMGATWHDNDYQAGLFRSKGFCSKNKEIVWETAHCAGNCQLLRSCGIKL